MSSFPKVWPGSPTMDHVDQDRICMEGKSLADFAVPWLSCLVSTISWVVESRNLLCSLLTEVQSVSLKEEGVTLRSPTPLSHLCLNIPFLPTKCSSEYPIVIVILTTHLRV